MVTLVASVVTSAAVNALQNVDSYYTYWYLAEKKDHSSIFLPDQSDISKRSLYQQIDEFELSNMNSADLKQVFYAGKNDKIIATYYSNTELRFVKFE